MKIILTTTSVSGQTVIAEQGFEGLGSDTWNYIPPTQNANAPQVLVGAANYGVGYAKVGNNSMRFGGGSTTCSTAASPNCVNGQSTGGNCNDNQNGRILEFQPVEISCYYNVRVSVAYRTHLPCSGGPGFDASDQIFFEVSENGGPFSPAATINGFGDCIWNYSTTSVSCTGPAIQNPFVYNVPPGRNTLAFRIRLNVNRSDEVLYIDDVKLTGNLSGGFAYPALVCNTALIAAPSLDIDLVSGGTFSATPVGLNINSASGNITPPSSLEGLYTVNYIRFTEVCATSTVAIGGSIITTPIYHD
jgi:hypothetical protein